MEMKAYNNNNLQKTKKADAESPSAGITWYENCLYYCSLVILN